MAVKKKKKRSQGQFGLFGTVFASTCIQELGDYKSVEKSKGYFCQQTCNLPVGFVNKSM